MKLYQLSILVAVFFLSLGVNAQYYKLDTKNSNLSIEGTSNIHDWIIQAESFSGSITAEFKEGQLESIENLEFSVEAESLESGKGAMNKNTYKALETDDHKRITYKVKKVNTIQKTSGNNYKVNTHGTLEIAGTKRNIDLSFNLDQKQNRIILKGEYNLKMTDYGVEAPSAMFGTIKTGEEVVVKFNTEFTK